MAPEVSPSRVQWDRVAWQDEPWAPAFTVLDQRLRADGLEAADLSHQLAVMVEGLGALRAAEALHRRAAMLMTRHPVAPDFNRRRIDCACSLAANLEAQERVREAENVLRAAVALAAALLGPDDPRTATTKRRLIALWERSDPR